MQIGTAVDADLLSLLACPRDGLPLREEGRLLICETGHRYPVVEGVPVLLCSEKRPLLKVALESIFAAETSAGAPYFLNTVGGLSPERKRIIEETLQGSKAITIDPVISWRLLATSGYAYASLLGRLQSYPIPEIPFPNNPGNLRLLDVGCNWGRWSLSAAQKGWRVIGIDPSLGALMAARRMAKTEQQKIAVVCGDARIMPFQPNVFHAVFSYSVLQHFDEAQAKMILREISRVMRSDGVAKVQMAHRYGLRSTYHRIRPNYSKSGGYRVRYWRWSDIQSVFDSTIGPSIVLPEAFGGLGLIYSDRKIVPRVVRMVINISELLKRVSRVAPPLKYLADSVLVESRKMRHS
jgi:2-polyprenyl-3-methyl-5-hydroxy-6-metoxy-1,4-benzoquinol methylase/uncharacterized protein YbaR (Trm112 family)